MMLLFCCIISIRPNKSFLSINVDISEALYYIDYCLVFKMPLLGSMLLHHKCSSLLTTFLLTMIFFFFSHSIQINVFKVFSLSLFSFLYNWSFAIPSILMAITIHSVHILLKSSNSSQLIPEIIPVIFRILHTYYFLDACYRGFKTSRNGR